MSDLYVGSGSKFGMKISSAFDMFAKVTSIKMPELSRDAIDVTDMDSPDEAREFIGGLINGGTATVTINYLPSASHQIATAFAAKQGEFRIIFPKGDFQMDFAGVATNFAISDIVTDDRITATFSVQASGLPVITATAGGGS